MWITEANENNHPARKYWILENDNTQNICSGTCNMPWNWKLLLENQKYNPIGGACKKLAF